MDSSREKDQVLALKVMRLTKPSLMPSLPVYNEAEDIACVKALQNIQKSQLCATEGLHSFALGTLLTLPQNFGNIFLGETFSSYISVHNDSQQTCREIHVKADLQTSSQRLTLLDNNTKTVTVLGPSSSIDDVIQHEVKELGTHILVCAVSYVTGAGEKMFLRKFFKFQVLKPLDVKTKFYNAESDEVYLEAQIQNITPGPIFIEHVSLEPSSEYNINPLDNDSSNKVFGDINCMNTLDVRQYLYCLVPKPDSSSQVLRGVTNIGKLDIVWRTNMGEKGRLQTSALQRVAPGYGDLRVTVENIPDHVQVEKMFNLVCKITNCSERTMDLELLLDNSQHQGMRWCGISGVPLGKCAPNASIVKKLEVIALQLGIQTVSGLRIVDSFLKRTYEHDELAQVFVYSNNSYAS